MNAIGIIWLILLKAMYDIGVVMTPFGNVATLTQGVGHVDFFYKVARGNDKN